MALGENHRYTRQNLHMRVPLDPCLHGSAACRMSRMPITGEWAHSRRRGPYWNGTSNEHGITVSACDNPDGSGKQNGGLKEGGFCCYIVPSPQTGKTRTRLCSHADSGGKTVKGEEAVPLNVGMFPFPVWGGVERRAGTWELLGDGDVGVRFIIAVELCVYPVCSLWLTLFLMFKINS